jgi:hypothetical protein
VEENVTTKISLIRFIALSVLLATAAFAKVPPKSKLSCQKANSRAELRLAIRNNGPDDLPAGERVIYSYKATTMGQPTTGEYTLTAPLPKGKSVVIVATDPKTGKATPWNTPVEDCTCRVKF